MYIIMTASETMPKSCKGIYRRVAIVETDGVTTPKQIHPLHKAVISIPYQWRRLNVGKTNRCAYQRALCEAQTILNKLNGGV